MEFSIVQNDHLEKTLKIVEELKESALFSRKEVLRPVYNTKELSSLFKVSSRTIQNWRDSGNISFSQIGGTILYSSDDILEFLKKHHNASFKK